MSERFACKVVGVHRSTFRRLPLDQTPDDPDAGTRAWLREYARKNPCHGFRRAWAALRFDEGHRVNRKRVHRLWKQEGLQVRVHHRRKRLGCRRSRFSRPVRSRNRAGGGSWVMFYPTSLFCVLGSWLPRGRLLGR
ncbi:IS3 family transposase [Nocardia amamiensis]|uniref:IS3 family transposase n=1 Tax=Nocardia amamiensis TaxID=404578 RepID=UPI0035A248CD